MGLGTASVLCALWRSHGLRFKIRVVEDGLKRDADPGQTFIAQVAQNVVGADGRKLHEDNG